MFQPSIDVVAWPGLGPTGVWVVRPAVPCQTTYFLAVVWWIHWFVLSAYGMMFIVSSFQGPVLDSLSPTESGTSRSAASPPSPSVPLCLCGEYQRASKLRARLSREATLCGAREAGIHHRDTEAQRGTEKSTHLKRL